MIALAIDGPLRVLLTLWLALTGLAVGSFLNVVIARVPHGRSVVHPRSACPRCGRGLSWAENIPVLSWVLLRGRCKGCREPISGRYPLVELLTGTLYLACLIRFGWSAELALALGLVTLVIPLTFIDIEHYLLPHSLTLPGIALGIALSALVDLERVRDAAIGAAAGFLLFAGLEWVGRKLFGQEALGGGDKYLLAMLGAFLTYRPLLAVVFLSSLQGAVVGSLLLLFRGRAGPELPSTSTSPADADVAAPPLDELLSGAEGEARSPAAPPAPQEQDAPLSGTEGEAHSLAAPSAPQEQDEDDWVPGPTNLPFGPYLALASLQIVLAEPLLSRLLPSGVMDVLMGRWLP